MNLLILAILAIVATGPSAAWRGDLFARAVENGSTTSDYVLVTIVDGKGSERLVCVKAPLLLGAIHREYEIRYDQVGVDRARSIALSSTDGRFVFKRRSARANVEPWYESTELVAARSLVSGLSTDAIVSGLEEAGSLRAWLDSSPHGRPLAHESALAHALLELGFLPSSGCYGGLQLSVVPANLGLDPTAEPRPRVNPQR